MGTIRQDWSKNPEQVGLVKLYAVLGMAGQFYAGAGRIGQTS